MEGRQAASPIDPQGGLKASDAAPGLAIGSDVEIGAGVQLGANVVIHDGVRLGDGCVIQDGAVLGKLPLLGPHSSAVAGPLGPTVLEEGSVVGCNSVVTAGAHLGPRAWVGEHVLLRDGARLEAEAAVGICCGIGPGAVIGLRAKVQSHSGITAGVILEEDVLVGGSVFMITQSGLGNRRDAGPQVLRRGCVIGSNVTIFAGLEIGEQAVVGSGTVVTEDVPPRTLVFGSPGQVIRELEPDELRG